MAMPHTVVAWAAAAVFAATSLVATGHGEAREGEVKELGRAAARIASSRLKRQLAGLRVPEELKTETLRLLDQAAGDRRATWQGKREGKTRTLTLTRGNDSLEVTVSPRGLSFESYDA